VVLANNHKERQGTFPPRALPIPALLGKRLHDWIRSRPAGLAVLAVVVGVGAGGGALLFRYLISWLTLLFTGHADYSSVGRAPNPFVPGLGIWFVILAPAIGGLIYGPLVQRFAPEARGHGVPEVMLAVAEHSGRIRYRVAAIKSLASALCIGSGGSVGREGPIVQIGSALGSALGQTMRIPESRLRLLVASGAAAGISATFNAPIAGAVFALELILRDFAAESFGMVVLSSVAASIVGRAAFGSAAFLSLPPFEIGSIWEYFFYGGLGLLSALIGVAFIRVLYGTEDLLDHFWRGPEGLRPAAGGLVLGALLIALPQMYGVGYPVLEDAIRGHFAVMFLLVLLVGKIAATSLTIGIGGSGGVFAPSLFMGAMLGSAYGAILHRLAPSLAGTPGAYGLVGMGAVFAATARAPMTSVIIVFELTGEYRIILPLLFAIAVSTSVSSLLTRDTIYTLKLRRRGIDVLRGSAATVMQALKVRDAMRPVPAPLVAHELVSRAMQRLADERTDALPVVDRDGSFRGTLTSREVEEALRANTLDSRVSDLVIGASAVDVDQSLEDAIGALVEHDVTGVAVLDRQKRSVVGWLTRRDVLRAYQAARLPSRHDASTSSPRGS
jgi:CIC family chloride channel protein